MKRYQRDNVSLACGKLLRAAGALSAAMRRSTAARWFRQCIVLAPTLAAYQTDVLKAQQDQRASSHLIQYRVSCAACRLTLTTIAELELGPSIPLLGGHFKVRRDSKGRLYATNYDATQIVVFSSQGRYVTSLGRPGSGPGEFSGLRPIRDFDIGRGDTLFVATPQALVVFSPALTYVRSIRMLVSGSGSRVPLADGTLLATGNVTTRDAVGLQFHILSPNGERQFSFGGDDRPVIPGGPRSGMLPTVVMSPDGRSFWGWNRNRMQHWSTDGNLLHDYTLTNVPWFASYQEFNVLDAANAARAGRPAPRPSNPRFEIIGVDHEGYVWIEGAVPVPAPSAAPNQRQFRRHVEVFDPVAKVVVMSQPIGFAVRRIPRSDLILGMTEDTSGVWRFTIYRAAIVRP